MSNTLLLILRREVINPEQTGSYDMTDFTFHTPDTAPEGAKPALESAQKQLGFAPNLYAGLANAPTTLQAY